MASYQTEYGNLQGMEQEFSVKSVWKGMLLWEDWDESH